MVTVEQTNAHWLNEVIDEAMQAHSNAWPKSCCTFSLGAPNKPERH